ncbi:hypothetical protein OOZ15_13995 [Galbibacter sp. EGI 63066]|uniref:hypothetical protein n=1 Tax=Galbibacter sp. EGI 63066 TaxID=2993559 RepID=UPI002248E0C8|nr:hypothetical protein [Galbibacter sp. EGI 63066]MCX2681060.1 hypothetical protein [Galbibacter sp. EGI 63066]
MEKSEEEINEWKEYRRSILEEKSKSDDDFEKYITYISSGALGLTMTFFDKISPLEKSISLWIIATGWIALAITLFVNLLSHYLSSRYNEKTVQDLDSNISYEKLSCNIDRRNNKISILNLASIILLGLGILLILIFSILNLSKHG